MADTVGKLIREARTKAGLTQEQLARKVGGGMTAAQISRAERGEDALTQEQLKKIAKATGVTQTSLLSAARESGSRTGGSATMTLDGRTFARLIYPYLQSEARRMGTTVKL